LGDRNRKTGLKDAIEQSAPALDLVIEKDASFRGVIFDYVLTSSERRRILVQISESGFLLDEIDHGREIVEAQKRLAEEHHRTRTCVVMIGYSSLEVRDALERVVDRVLVYDEAKFGDEFRNFASQALLEMTSSDPPVPVPQIGDATRILNSAEVVRTARIGKTKAALDEAGAPQQRRQEELLAQQADEQMWMCIAELENSLGAESDLLIRLNHQQLTTQQTADRLDDLPKAIIGGLSLITVQYAGLKRARTIAERENAASSVAGGVGVYQQELGKAETFWHKLFRSPANQDLISSIDSYYAGELENSLATRRKMLLSIDERWLKRRRKAIFDFSDVAVTVPLLIAALILGWLGVGYWQISRAQQQAIEAFRDSLKGVIAFALDYENTGTFKQENFSTAVTHFETSLLNPALPGDLSANTQVKDYGPGEAPPTVGGLRELISDCREYCETDVISQSKSDHPLTSNLDNNPVRIIVPNLRSSATRVLQNTYRLEGITFWTYSKVHNGLLGGVALLILWATTWRHFREFFRRIVLRIST
jgi:hypothetical protein